ncbi:MAG TPA: DUF4214 domain-containing protein [Gemmataceae bacterium]|nr:DUF4214 domain-containing protein [Gemmataceae bacterium]
MQLEPLEQRWLPTGDFTNINAILPGIISSSMAWGDYGNGHLDLAISGIGPGSSNEDITQVYTGDGTGGFTLDAKANLPGVREGSLAWGDYNNDGHLDLVVSGFVVSTQTAITQVYTGDGTGGFTLDTNANLPGVYSGSVAWGDYNNDGNLGLVISGLDNSGTPITQVYAGDGKGGFTLDANANLPGVEQGSVAWGDYNSDGHLDLLISGNTSANIYPPITQVYTGDGKGGFTLDANANLPGVEQGSVAWGDYNNDGHLDLVISGLDSSETPITRVYTGDGNGGFTLDANAILTGVCEHSMVAWGDFNNDGNLDLVICGSTISGGNTPITQVYTGDGNGGFTLDANANLTGVYAGSLAWGDYDNDGLLDLVISGYDSSNTPITQVYQNTSGAPANSPPAAPTGLSTSSTSPTSATFSWNAAIDSQEASAGLSYALQVGTTPGGDDIVDPMSNLLTGQRMIQSFGPVEGTSYTLTGLTPGTTYYWSVQAVDGGLAGGAFATEQSVTLPSQGNQAPAITSANKTTFTVGSAGSFTVTATGSPTPTLTESGALPSGVSFNDATGLLSGTPPAGTSGNYAIMFAAGNGVGTNATQSFTLTVNQSPAITSANKTTFTVGSAGSFTVSATGFPTPVLSESGALPSGITFNAGTGILGGTPAAGASGTYPLTFTAGNGVGTNATQSFTLTVSQSPAITSANNTTFTVGTVGSFTVTATGSPTPVLSESGALPSGVTFNAGSGILGGAPVESAVGTYPLTFTASNGVGTNATQSFTLTVSPAAANNLAFSAQPSNSMAGGTIGPAVQVQVLDAFGNLETGDNSDRVTLSVASGPGGFTTGSTTTVTVSRGIATFSNLVLDTPGAYTLGESATSGLIGPNSNSFTVSALPADHLAFSVQPTTITAGAALSPSVKVEVLDRLGNLVIGDNSDQVVLSVVSGPGGFAGGSTMAVTVSGGIATFSNLTLDTAGSYTLGESATGGLSGTNSNSFTIDPATADHLGFGVPLNGSNAGRAISPGVVVKVLDQFGNVFTGDNGDQVTLTIASGPGGFAPGSTTTATVSGGIATFSNLVFDTTGNYTLAESATGQLNGPNSSSFMVIPGAAKSLTFSAQPSNSVAGETMSPAVQVQVLDAYGNLETLDNNDQVTLSVAGGQGGFTSGSTTTVSDSKGVAVFTGLSLDKAATSYTLRATSPDLTATTSNAFAVTPGPATHIMVSAIPSDPIVADSAINITLTLLDAGGDIAIGYTGTLSFSSSDAQAMLPNNYTFTQADKGRHTFSVTMESSGAQMLVATDAANASLDVTANMLVVVVSKIVPVNPVAVIYGPAPNASQNDAFIKGLYRLILGRDADVGGLDYWLSVMSTNGSSLQERQEIVEQGFWNSYENRAREVNGYYETYLERKADPQGLGFWIAQLQNGEDETAVVAYFLLQQEAAKLSNNAWLTNLYAGALGRSPDAAGFTYWLGQLSSNQLTRTQVEQDFVLGTEAAGAAVDSFYIDYLQRVPDAQGRANLVNSITSGSATYASVAELVLASDEFFANAAKNVS